MNRHLSTGSLSLKKQLELTAPWELTGAFLSTEVNTMELGPPLSRAYDRFWGTSPALGAVPRILNEAPCPPSCPASGAPQGWPGPFSSNLLSLQSSSWATWSTPCPLSQALKPLYAMPIAQFLILFLALYPWKLPCGIPQQLNHSTACPLWTQTSAGCEGDLLRGEAAVRAMSELRGLNRADQLELVPPPTSSVLFKCRAGQSLHCVWPWLPPLCLTLTLTGIPPWNWTCFIIMDFPGDLLSDPDYHPQACPACPAQGCGD